MKVYLVGSLRAREVVWAVAEQLREAGHEVFDDWSACHPEADDEWKVYEKARGRTYLEALHGDAAKHIFQFDMSHLVVAEAVVLVAPAGRSAHVELGWAKGAGKYTAVILNPGEDRWDIMLQLFDRLTYNVEDIIDDLHSREVHLTGPAPGGAY